MKKRQIISLILAGALIAGTGFGIRVLADETDTTPPVQTQEENTDPAFPWNGMIRGRGAMRGCFGGITDSNLTVDQQKELNALRVEAQNIMLDYRERQLELREILTEAIAKGDQAEILAAWEQHTALHEEIQINLEPVRTAMAQILGEESAEWGFFQERFETNPMSEQMEALKNAATDEEALEIIEDLQNFGGGRGSRGRGNKGFRSQMPWQGETPDETAPRGEFSNNGRGRGMNRDRSDFGRNRR